MMPQSAARVLITAGASGIGRAIAERFAANGARVHVCDVSEAAIASFANDVSGAGTSPADVAREDDVERLFAAVRERLGGLDVLVNNAGIGGPTATIDRIEPEEWRRTVDVNLTGMFYCTRRAVPMLRESRGAIVNISSVAGRLGYALRTPYAATKWAVVGLTQSLAKELGPDGVRVNAVLPGIVEGARMSGVIEARARASERTYADVEAEYLGRVSLRRMVTAQDVAEMVAFLCSPAARNISGQTISVDGNVESL